MTGRGPGAYVARPIDVATQARYRGDGWWRDGGYALHLDRLLRARAGAQVHRLGRDGEVAHHEVAAVHRAAARVATILDDLGDDPTAPVWVRASNSVESLVVLLGVLLSARPLLPLGLRVTDEEVGALTTYVPRGQLLDLTGSPLVSATQDADALLRVIRTDLQADEPPPGPRPIEQDPSAPALIGVTAGTEGTPKAVVHSSQTLDAEVRQLAGAVPELYGPLLVPSPICHAIGLLSGVFLPLVLGHDLHLMEVWNPDRALGYMRSTGVSCGSGTAFFCEGLLRADGFAAADAALMAFAGLGGAPTPPALVRELDDRGVHAYRMYGSTEHPSVTSSSGLASAARLGSEGIPLPGVDLRLVVDEDSAGGFGRVETRGPDACIGIYRRGELGGAPFTEDGYVRVGDFARLDDDGNLVEVTRRGETINHGGAMVSPRELEVALEPLLGTDVAVVGRPAARSSLVEDVVLCVPEQVLTPTLDLVREHLRSVGVARSKHPTDIVAVADIPRNDLGKVDRVALVGLIDKRQTGDPG